MHKLLRRTLAGLSLAAAMMFPAKSKAENLEEPLELSLQNAGMEFSEYGNINYGFEDNFELTYNGDLIVRYGELEYNTGESNQDAIDALVQFANSNENMPVTPLDNIFNQAFQFPAIRNQSLGRFSLQDFSMLFKSFHDIFDIRRSDGLTSGSANITINGHIDLEHYARNYFRQGNHLAFFDHNSQLLAYGFVNARMDYLLLENEPIVLGTEYDEFINKRLDMSLRANFDIGKFMGESYRIGIIDGNNSYGLGIMLTRSLRIRGTESANLTVSSELDNIMEGRIGFLDANENHTITREDGDEGLAYLFHSGHNGLLWHSGYIGLNIPDGIRDSETRNVSRFLSITLKGTDNYNDEYYDYTIEYYDLPRLDYGLLIGYGPDQFQPVLSVSRLRGSRFFLNISAPYRVFNISSDLKAPINVFLTSDRSNEKHLSNFIRATEENYSMPVVAVNAMNDSARLAAYSRLDNLVASFSSNDGRLTASVLYANRGKYFIELGGERTVIHNYGVFLRGGIPNLMATAGYSYNNSQSESYWSNGFVLNITGRSDNLFYNLSTRKMLLNPNRNYVWPNDINDSFRVDLTIGGNF